MSDMILEKTIEELKEIKADLYERKIANLDRIAGMISALKAELDTRDLSTLKTGELARLLVSLAELEKKGQPKIAIKDGQPSSPFEPVNKIVF